MEKDTEKTYYLREKVARTEKGEQYEEERRRRTERETTPQEREEEAKRATDCISSEEEEENGAGDSPTRKRQETRSDEITNMFQLLMAEMKQQNLDIGKKLEQQSKKLEQQSHQHQQTRTELQQLGVKWESLKEEMRQNMFDFSQRLESKLHAELEEQKIHFGGQINEIQHKMEENVKTIKETSYRQGQTEHKVQGVQERLEEEIRTRGREVEDLQSQIINEKDRNKEMEEEIRKVKEARHSGPKEIHVTCGGVNPLDQKAPTYNGKGRNPREFLKRLQHYWKTLTNQNRPNSQYTLPDLIDRCLEGGAAQWWQVVRRDDMQMTEFETLFLDKYWNHDIQKGVKRKIELEKYGRGYQTRAEYFIERVLILKNLYPPMDERDIVLTLNEHYDPTVQDARRVQNITTISDFENLLAREDLNETNIRLRGDGREENWNRDRLNYRPAAERNPRNPPSPPNRPAYQGRNGYPPRMERNNPQRRWNNNHRNTEIPPRVNERRPDSYYHQHNNRNVPHNPPIPHHYHQAPYQIPNRSTHNPNAPPRQEDQACHAIHVTRRGTDSPPRANHSQPDIETTSPPNQASGGEPRSLSPHQRTGIYYNTRTSQEN